MMSHLQYMNYEYKSSYMYINHITKHCKLLTFYDILMWMTILLPPVSIYYMLKIVEFPFRVDV